MEEPDRELVFIVRHGPSGWVIEDGKKIGPFFSKQRALDLATGMVEAITSIGLRARVEVE